MDRVIEGHMEFNMKKPKDRLRMYAVKEKSPYTVIFYDLSFKGKRPRDLYKYDRDDDILKSRVETSATVITDYPGGDTIRWLPKQIKLQPDEQIEFSGLEREHESNFHNSKFFEIFVGIWYNKIYQKEISRYEEEARETMKRIHNLMRERYGVEKSIERTGASQYQPPWE